MNPAMRRGLLIALIHLLMVTGVGAKLLIDRATRPRVWARTAPVDPDLPIRGRYVSLRIEGDASQLPPGYSGYVTAMVNQGTLTFRAADRSEGSHARVDPVRGVAVLDQPLAYFIPEHIRDPSLREPGEELWVEVTLPRRGAPRPIRLGIKRGGVLTPIP